MALTTGKDALKNLLGQIPFTAELYWLFRQGDEPQTRYSLKHLQENLPEIMTQVGALDGRPPSGKKIFIFASLHYWIEQATLLGLALATQSHRVTLGYLPYGDWLNPVNKFDMRRLNLYTNRTLNPTKPYLDVVSFSTLRPSYLALPESMREAIRQTSVYDCQYTTQVEEVDTETPLYHLRMERNENAARVAMAYFKSNRPDVVVVPNGMILEMGMVYRVARCMGIPTVVYEFGNQRSRIFLAQNDEILHQDTDRMWKVRQGTALTDSQVERMRSLFTARQQAASWENFTRPWQGIPAQGGEQARIALKLDARPVCLLATNVIGESLTLGRNLFSHSMTEWVERTLQYFAGRPDVQLVVRVHPGEQLSNRQTIAGVVKQVFPRLPENIHLVGATDSLNTYDLFEVADLGVVYTSTVGLEMALNGLPVVVAGKTHYRGRGFTSDPDTWVGYFKMLGAMLDRSRDHHLTREQVDLAWQYAYSFFFEFPKPYPWHLVRLWDDYRNHPLQQVFSPEGMAHYGATFRYLAGEPVEWELA
jgi:hypothetical protein